MKKLINSRKFRETYTTLNESVIVIRRDEVLGTWTPSKDRRSALGESHALPQRPDPTIPGGV